MNRNFNDWLSKFKASISNYTYYVDFKKIYEQANKYKVELNILNSLIGSKNIESEFQKIIIKYPETLEVIPALLAVRSSEIYVKDKLDEYLFKFDKLVYSIEDYIKFMRETGLFDLLQNHIINNLYDYLLGVEVGLDSNGRKNRGGHLMENLVESYIVKAGYTKDKTYFKEMYTSDIEDKWNIDLSILKGEIKATKRWDFVIKTNNQIYVIETNFYATQGSKLNETARSYELIANKVKQIDGLTFIWITDGIGWNNAKLPLNETFNVLDTLYSINDLDNGVLERLDQYSEVFITNFDLEKYKDGLPIIEPKNPFLDIPKVNINELDNYINHRVWIRSKTSYNYFEEHIYTLERIDMEKNKVFFQNNICIDFDDLIGIESLNVNYNEQIINFKQFVGKKVRITNKYNNFIDCALQAVYDEEIYFAVRLANYDSLSYDLSYPINLIKKIEII